MNSAADVLAASPLEVRQTAREVDLKTLQILFIILLCATPLYADQALLLTEIEQIQEKIWHLQRDIAGQKGSVTEYQNQLKLLGAKADDGHLEIDERLSGLAQTISSQQEKASLIETDLKNLNEALATLTSEVRQQNSAMPEQTKRINTLEGSLRTLQVELASQQTSTEQELAETRKQLIETRAQVDMLGQDVGGRIEQIGLWGAGAALILVIVLTIVIVGRKNKPKKQSSDWKQPPKHEM